ncbi:MAG: DUF2062 domain-containing protein [Luminiphilus sp.]|jgi:uncharacterized protein|nr:DUF2062 domain-containing protein [Luminiphilus sp.]
MLKKRLRQWIPAPSRLRQHRSLRIFGAWAEESRLWQLSRQSTAKAFAIGLYCAMLPIPGQMFISVALAIIFTANLPISFALIFITNPLTMPAIFYGAYKLGAWCMGRPPMEVEFEASWTWFTQSLDEIWVPLVVGSQILGVLSAILGYLLVDTLWRNAIRQQWRARERRRLQ